MFSLFSVYPVKAAESLGAALILGKDLAACMRPWPAYDYHKARGTDSQADFQLGENPPGLS